MALASQSARSQTMPRSSAAYNRSVRGGRSRQKRLVGIVLLAGVCVGITFWAVRHRDGAAPGPLAGLTGPAAASAAKPAETGPGGASLIAPDPLGGAAAKPTTETPSLAMGYKPQPPATNPVLGGPVMSAAQPTSSKPLLATKPQPAAAQPTPSAPTPTTATDPGAGTPTAEASPTSPGAGGVLGAAVSAADRAQAQGKVVDARAILNRALLDPRSSESERSTLRQRIAELNQALVFGPAQTPGDPFSESYRVAAGDSLNKITRKLQLATEPSVIARINKLTNPGALKVGQSLKVLRGPFHAVVHKSAFRMDIYAGPTPSPTAVGTSGTPDNAEPGWTYICSFPVGLGAQGLTPLGAFTIKENSKLINPHWVNPRTGEKFGADDPKNPIGERWMGLEGLDEKSRAFTGYGIHGTIDPSSIGHEMSMGCVRMQAADVEQVYELLAPRVSVVKIVP